MLYRGWDTQSPMPIGKLVLFCRAMGIFLIFVNIEVQSILLNHTCLETAVYCIPYRLGSYFERHDLDPVIWIFVEILSKNHFGQWRSALCGCFTNENYEVMVPSDTRLWPCNKHPITHGILWIDICQRLRGRKIWVCPGGATQNLPL